MYESAPDWIWWNGTVTAWPQARLHVTSETALRGINVFEGIRAYWQPGTERWAVIELESHLRRLANSAALMHIPVDRGLAERMRAAIRDLVAVCGVPGTDLYLRPTVYVDNGRYTASATSMSTGEFIACHRADPSSDSTIRCVVSRWRRIPDSALPTRAKTGAAYTAFRQARIEALDAGAEEAILLNTDGMVSETPGAAVFAVSDGVLVTPPLSDGLLEGITRAAVIGLTERELGLSVVEKSLTAENLHTAQEVFLAGTLDEVRVVSEIDGIPTPSSELGSCIRSAYVAMCRGTAPLLHQRFVEIL
ncbi:aminotransferase class IV [Nocardia sp. NPDC060259]|uniref:aminotransferase class IV n=1 Tax=Nocardia sp. NPDC060259 TaxID=3347088 RepID=UPI003654099B